MQSGSPATTNLNLTMGYTKNGNITNVQQEASDTGNTTFSNTFQYDGLDRLTSVTSALFPNEEYTFDSLSRMTTRKFGTATPLPVSYNDPAHKDGPTYYNGQVYNYDPNGNQTSRVTLSNQTTQGRAFDPEGRVTQIISGTTTTEMVYDANGTRLLKNIYTPSTGTSSTSKMLCQAVEWQNAVNVTVQGHSINKSGGTESWSDAGASSLSSMGAISSGQDGYVTAQADRTDQHKMVGLSKGDEGQSYTDIDYAIEMAAGGVLKIHEGGDPRGTFGTYSVGGHPPCGGGGKGGQVLPQLHPPLYLDGRSIIPVGSGHFVVHTWGMAA